MITQFTNPQSKIIENKKLPQKFNEEEIVKLYLEGKNTVEIANMLSTYNTSIRRVLLRNNITLRSTSEVQAETKNVFKDFEKEEVQYWLGFLSADGTIGNKEFVISLELQEKDLNHLLKFKEFIGIKSLQTMKYPKINKIGYRVSCKNKETNLFLKSLGITDNKSLTIKYKKDFTNHYLRGYFDGNGYTRKLGKNRAEISIATGSEEFAKQILYYYQSNNITAYLKKTKENLFTIGIYSKDSCKKCYNLMYNNATLFLERKKNVLCPLFDENFKDAKSSNSVNL